MSDRETPRPVALVTGGTRGIGFGIARSLAASGWDLALSGLRPPGDVTAAIDTLTASGAVVEYCPADIGVAGDRARLVETTLARFGRVNLLVNNAGRAPRTRADLLVASEDSFEEVMRTNLQGPFFLTQRVAGLLARTREADPSAPAAIVFITSVSAAMVSVSRGEYCVSKAGLAMTASLFAARLAEQRIPVFEVRPGIIATDMTSAVKELYDQRIADGLVPDRRWGTPDDVGRVVAALARGDLPYATGSIIHVDGGLAIPRL
jgi:NAD(P)-dependent dehydrogenase (short-subunit alcohol dehydrogenase family)